MKTRIKIIIGLMTVCAAAFLGAACAADSSPYGDFDEKNFTVSVRYDSNGGMFASTSNINLVDVFPVSLFEKGGVKLIEPGDADRGAGQVRSQISRSGYFLAGWYRGREERVSDSGEKLDVYGNPMVYNEKGEALVEQGYIYSDPWDFDTDLLEIESGKKYTSSEVVLTLYAAWVPNFQYTFYAESESGSGWTEVATYSFNPVLEEGTLSLPEWNEDTGAMDYDKFPQLVGKTFSAVYSDAEKTDECEGSLIHTGEVDYEKGIAVDAINYYYSEWLDGTWFRIRTAKQLTDNARSDGYYEIYEDLDFTDVNWSDAFARGDFTGRIYGNGHTLSNITVKQVDSNNQLRGGLFGFIRPQAVIKDVTFEDVTYQLLSGTRQQGAEFGLFAGNLSNAATIENVTVTGEFQVGGVYALYLPVSERAYYDGYSIGLLTGNLETKGITYSITCKAIEVTVGTTTSYPCKVSVNDDGSIEISTNPNPSQDPN